MLSIIIPTLNEQNTVAATLARLQPERGDHVELIVIDGGSADETLDVVCPLAHAAISRRGRAAQMNAGAAIASGDVLLFLHADTQLPPGGVALVAEALGRSECVWGRFDVRIASANPVLRVVSHMMNLRSRWSGIATGDQAIFVRRAAFERVGGFPDIPLMEDIALSSALRRISRPVCLRTPVLTSPRRWQKNGVVRTILLMWWLRFAYFCGADPARLALSYGYAPRED
jgi:rSAM/selenodomain-associated transferase 2